MEIREIMTKNPACGVPDSSLEELARLMVKVDCGAIPIVNDREDMTPLGIVTDRDITCRTLANGKDPMGMKAKEIMTTTLVTLPPEATLAECCELMEQRQIRRMIVVDDDGSCVGIIAQADIARLAPAAETVELVKDVSRSASATA